jgi:hypothetical protein
MNEITFAAWVGRLGRAWEQRDPHEAAALFSQDVVYSTDPFAAPLHGRPAVLAYWQAELARHDQVRCEFEVIGLAGESGVAHWHTTLSRPGGGARVALDGLIVARFNQQGECASLREWWHSDEE